MNSDQNNGIRYDLMSIETLNTFSKELGKTMACINSSINCCQSFDDLKELIILKQNTFQTYNDVADAYQQKLNN